ncbi:MAG: hypothetical protein AB7O52_19320 [Planctomycetota bacterium]
MSEIAQVATNSKVGVELKNGKKLEGKLLRTDRGGSVIQVDYGSVSLTTGEIRSMKEEGAASPTTPVKGRLLPWDACLETVASREWASALKQVPATVIDRGVLAQVPYMSHRSGGYEINIYGDPDQPAGLEIGFYKDPPPPGVRRECVETLCLLLADAEDQEIVRRLDLTRGTAERKGLTFEVTPPTAPDAYGAWWISVYDTGLLEYQRASTDELATITRTCEEVCSDYEPTIVSWKPVDLQGARPPANTDGDARVYVRGIHRHDGTYVVASGT